MAGKGFSRQLPTMILPVLVLLIVPFLILFNFSKGIFNIGRVSFVPMVVQVAFGGAITLAGLLLMAVAIGMLIRLGRGTLAPWDQTEQLVRSGIYAHTRNPLISGVLIVLIGETVIFWSFGLLIWTAIFLTVNTVYFKLSEEPGLVRRFGDEYREYRRNVPMWIPRVKPWKG